MVAQMEQFCQHYNLSRLQIDSVCHVIDESLTILGTAPGTRLTLAYAEKDDMLQMTVNSPQPINPDAFIADDQNIAVTILRNFSRDITIDGDTLRIVIDEKR